MEPIFVGGADRSGTTLLASLLGAIDGFTTVGELSLLWSRALPEAEPCGCGESVRACPYWTAVLARAFPDGPPDGNAVLKARAKISGSRQWLRSKLLGGYRGEIIGPLNEYRRLMLSLYSAIAEASGSRVVVDSSKFVTHVLPLAGGRGLDVTVVHLVRDSRAVAYSLQRPRFRPQGSDRLAPMTTAPCDESASYWLRINAITNVLGRVHGRYVRVRYEDLINDPRSLLTRIARSLGETPASFPLTEPAVSRLEVQHTISGNPSRFRVGMVPLRLDDEWVHRMRSEDRRAVMARTWPLMAAYGYIELP
jgi:hypothetical protein